MNLTILPAYGYPQEISELFSEYTELLIAGNSAFRDYLALQNYDEEQALSGTETDRLIPDTPYDPRLHPDTLRGSLLTPEQIAWSQRGTAVFTGGGRAECGISIHIYRLRLENTAPLLLRCLQSEQRAYWRWYQKNSGELYMNPVLSEFQDFQPLDRPAFDALSVLSWRTADMDVPRQFYAGQAGNIVFTLTCWGPADASLAMELFHEIIAVQ